MSSKPVFKTGHPFYAPFLNDEGQGPSIFCARRGKLESCQKRYHAVVSLDEGRQRWTFHEIAHPSITYQRWRFGNE